MVRAESMDSAEATHSKHALLEVLGRLALRSGVLDPNQASEASAALELTSELSRILETGIEVLGQLERLVSPTSEDEYQFPDKEESTWIGTIRSKAATAPRLADTCFAAMVELNRALRQLVQANGGAQRLVAAEAARRKLHRALYAVLANSVEPGTSEPGAATLLRQRFAVELESALVVRRMYAQFRRSLRRAEDSSRESVLTALRYAAGALATLTTSPHHGTIRLADRLLLSQQRDRLLDWSRAGRPAASGLQLLEDIWTCADLLRDINRRQELCAHDQGLVRELLHPAAQGGVLWVIRLERLLGLDDELDRLIARASKGYGAEVMMDVLLRLSCLV